MVKVNDTTQREKKMILDQSPQISALTPPTDIFAAFHPHPALHKMTIVPLCVQPKVQVHSSRTNSSRRAPCGPLATSLRPIPRRRRSCSQYLAGDRQGRCHVTATSFPSVFCCYLADWAVIFLNLWLTDISSMLISRIVGINFLLM